MKRLMNLVLFELRKILNRKKAFLFLLVMNVVPIISSIVLLIAYISCKGFGFGNFQFAVMRNIIQSLFSMHFIIFAISAPFFLALVVGDSFSTEFSKGYMKMLLITPIRRWQVITAKSMSIMCYLLIAVILGGLILQVDLLFAKGITEPGFLPAEASKDIKVSPEVTDQIVNALPPEVQKHVSLNNSVSMVSVPSAFRLLVITFVANLMLIGFLIVLSMFFESAILMSLSSLAILMGIHVFYWLSSIKGMSTLVEWFPTVGKFCFTRHYADLFSINIIQNIIQGKLDLLSNEVIEPISFSLLWAVIFYAVAVFIFSRKQILH